MINVHEVYNWSDDIFCTVYIVEYVNIKKKLEKKYI